MAKKVKLINGGQTVYPATVMDAVVHKDLRVDSSKLIEEVNVSKIFPTGGIGGSNKYTLETAIAMIPASLRTVGLKCSFLGETGELEEWTYKGKKWDAGGFVLVGAGKINELYKSTNVYNLDYEKPLLEEFYDSESARLAVPEAIRKIGLIITYKISKKDIVLEQFVGDNISRWTSESSWSNIGKVEDYIILNWNTDAQKTRLQIKQKERKTGLLISYIPEGQNSILEIYIGTLITDTEWGKDNNWVKLVSDEMLSLNIQSLQKEVRKIDKKITGYNIPVIFQNHSYEGVGLYKKDGYTALGITDIGSKTTIILDIADNSKVTNCNAYASGDITEEHGSSGSKGLKIIKNGTNIVQVTVPEGVIAIGFTYNGIINEAKYKIEGDNSILDDISNLQKNIDTINNEVSEFDGDIEKTKGELNIIVTDDNTIQGAISSDGMINTAITARLLEVDIHNFKKITYYKTWLDVSSRCSIVVKDKNGAVLMYDSASNSSDIGYRTITLPANSYKVTYSVKRDHYNIATFLAFIDDANNLYTLRKKISPDSCNIQIWGDSRTAQGWMAKSNQNIGLLGYINDIRYSYSAYGIGGERTIDIACRQGSIPMVCKGFTIPADRTPVDVDIFAQWNGFQDLKIFANTGNDPNVNPVKVAGILGNIERREAINDGKLLTHEFKFTRLEAGEQVIVKSMERVYSNGCTENQGDIFVFFMGANDGLTIDDLPSYIGILKCMAEGKRYIVVTDTFNGNEANYNKKQTILPIQAKMMYEAFGNHVVDLYNYALRFASNDEGLEISGSDAIRIENGEMPFTLTNDGVHQTEVMKKIMQRLVYEKGKELGYW